VTSKYEFIDAEKANYPIVKMCDWLNVSRSGFYEWQARPMSATAQRREYLKVHIAKHFELSHRTYGYRRIHAALVRQGEQVSAELVRDLMRELGLVACQPRPLAADHHDRRRRGACGCGSGGSEFHCHRTGREVRR
jgi:putative transposase